MIEILIEEDDWLAAEAVAEGKFDEITEIPPEVRMEAPDVMSCAASPAEATLSMEETSSLLRSAVKTSPKPASVISVGNDKEKDDIADELADE